MQNRSSSLLDLIISPKDINCVERCVYIEQGKVPFVFVLM